MTITVKLPNGGTASFPDGMAPAEIEAVLQKQFPSAPAGGKPGSREYADWARTQAMAGHKVPQVSPQPPEWQAPPNPAKSVLPGPLGAFQDFSNAAQSGFNQGLTFGFGDEIYAGATALPRAAIDAVTGRGFDIGRAYDEGLSNQREGARDAAALNPVAASAGEVVGAVVNPLSRGLGVGNAASTAGKVALGAGEGAALGGLYGFGTGDTMDERLTNAGWGAGGGAVAGVVAPWLAEKVGGAISGAAQRNATNTAIKGAPAAGDLKSAASQMFQQLDQNGVQVSGQRFGDMAIDLVRKFQKMRANPTLDPKAVAALQELVKAADDVQRSGGGITLSDLHTIRQIAQKSAQSAEGRDKMFSTQIINAIDDMISGLKPGDMVGGADPAQASKLMFDAISTWGRSRRVGLIEEAIYRAQNVASGPENGLRIEFRKLLQNPDTRKLFTDAERQAIEDVVRGNPVSNLTKLLGKFGFGPNGASNMLGGTIGFGAGSVFGGPVAGMVAAGLGTGARKLSEVLTTKAAERAAKVLATPNVPSLAPGPLSLAAKEAIERIGRVAPVTLVGQ
jgi:hypothetical protein